MISNMQLVWMNWIAPFCLVGWFQETMQVFLQFALSRSWKEHIWVIWLKGYEWHTEGHKPYLSESMPDLRLFRLTIAPGERGMRPEEGHVHCRFHGGDAVAQALAGLWVRRHVQRIRSQVIHTPVRMETPHRRVLDFSPSFFSYQEVETSERRLHYPPQRNLRQSVEEFRRRAHPWLG